MVQKKRLIDLFHTQARVIAAVTVREMEVDYGRYRLGYAWALVEPAIYVTLLSIMHVYIRKTGTAHGMTPVMFMVCGVLPWFMFSQTVSSVAHTRPNNEPLLHLPRVTILDLFAARALMIFCKYNVVFIVFAVPTSIIDGSWPPANVLAVVTIFNSAWLMGVGFGLVMAPLYERFPSFETLISLGLMRMGFWTSGLFFVIVDFPSSTWPYFAWNPILNVTELLRSAWFPVYVSPVGSPIYVAEMAIGLIALGLIVERLAHHRPGASDSGTEGMPAVSSDF
jgi:capsular polysaccharide transport system permease protein